MGNVYRHLYPQVYDWDNLMRAWRRARKGKRGWPPAATFEANVDWNLVELQLELQDQRYQPGRYVSFHIREPKRRLISAAPFRDRVVHHALCNVIEPLFERRFIHDSYANRHGKGTHAALDRCQQFTRQHRYVLQCDVEQFFPAIDHALLMTSLQNVIVDPDLLGLCQSILDSGRGVLSAAYDQRYFPGDDLFAAARPRGLPTPARAPERSAGARVGNLTSQFWANAYLNSLDHFVKRVLKCRAYLRYVDDFLLFADDKSTLWAWRQAVIEHLAGLRLTIHETRCHPQPVTEGIPFLGFTVFPTHRRLKRRTGIAYRRRLKGLLAEYEAGNIPFERVAASTRGWANHASHGQTYGLRKRMFRELTVTPPRRPTRNAPTAADQAL